MNWPNGRILEDIVHDHVKNLGEAILNVNPTVICPIPRRAARIFDTFLADDLGSQLEPLILYPSAIAYEPSMFVNQRIALVDNCVQRGKNLLSTIKRLYLEKNILDVFAFARCLWHGHNGQYTGVKISEPILECTEIEYKRLTSFVNYSFWDSLLPLDYEDLIVELTFPRDISEESLVNIFTLIGTTSTIPRQGSSVTRISTFVKSEEMLNGLLRNGSDLTNDRETKLLLNYSKEKKKGFLIPLVMYNVNYSDEMDLEVNSLSSEIRRVGEIVKSNLGKPSDIFTSAHLAGEAILSARVLRVLSDSGLEVEYKIKKNELMRYFGHRRGGTLHDSLTEMIDTERGRFDTSAMVGKKKVFPILEPGHKLFFSLRGSITNHLVDEYVSFNERLGLDWSEWVPKGLTFKELDAFVSKQEKVQDETLSLVLDELLASSWIKTQTLPSIIDEASATKQLATQYIATELSAGERKDKKLKSDARSVEDEREQNTKDIISLTCDSLGGVDPSHEVPWGHFLHYLAFLSRLIVQTPRKTLLEIVPNAHGMIPALVPCSRLPERSPIEEGASFLGFKVVNMDTRRLIICSHEILFPTAYSETARGIIREFERFFADWRKIHSGLHKLLLYISSCTDPLLALNAIVYDLRSIARNVEALRWQVPSGKDLREMQQFVFGASNKMEVSLNSAGYKTFLLEECARYGKGLSPTIKEFVTELVEDIPVNYCFSILSQLVTESRLLFMVSSKQSGQFDIFNANEQGDVPLISSEHLKLWWDDFGKQLVRLGRITDIEFNVIRDGNPDAFVKKVAHSMEKNCEECYESKKAIDDLIVIKLDAVGSRCGGDKKLAEAQWKRRETLDWIVIQFLVDFYEGSLVKRDRDGDSAYFGFRSEASVVRFIIAMVCLAQQTHALGQTYRIVCSRGRIVYDKNNISPGVMVELNELEGDARKAEKQANGQMGSILIPESVIRPPFDHLLGEGIRQLMLGDISYRDHRYGCVFAPAEK